MIVYSNLCNKMNFPRIDSRVRILRFSDVSGSELHPHLQGVLVV